MSTDKRAPIFFGLAVFGFLVFWVVPEAPPPPKQPGVWWEDKTAPRDLSGAQIIVGLATLGCLLTALYLSFSDASRSIQATKDGLPGAIDELMGMAKSSAQFSSIDTFPTKKGAVTVAWSIAPSLDMFGYAGDKLGARKAEIASKLHEALKGNPDIDLTRFQQSLGITITHVERSWDKPPDGPDNDPILGKFKETAKRAKNIMDLERAREAFIAQHKDVLDANDELRQDINFIFDSERGKFTVPDDYGRTHGQ